MDIDISFKTLKNLGNSEAAKKVYRILKKHELYTPERFDEYEPLKKIFIEQGESGFIKAWKNQSGTAFGEVMWRRKISPKSSGRVYILFGPYARDNYIGQSVHESICKRKDGISSLIEFATELFVELDMLYGPIHHEKDWEKKNMFIKQPQPDGSFLTYAVGADWEKYLPGVYWCNFFGKKYVEWFGRKKVLATPCWDVSELKDGSIRIIAYESPMMYQTDEALEAEGKIRKHLGEEAFFDIKDMNRPTIAPTFDFSALRPPRPS